MRYNIYMDEIKENKINAVRRQKKRYGVEPYFFIRNCIRKFNLTNTIYVYTPKLGRPGRIRRPNMAKNKFILTFFLAFLLGFTVLCGCAEKGADSDLQKGNYSMNSTEGLSKETERQIKLDFANWRPFLVGGEKSVRILEYYGNYNGCEVVLIEGYADADAVTEIVVAGMSFWFSSANVALVWKRGENPASGPFYTLKEAYDLGFLILEDIKKLHKRYYEVCPPYMKEWMERR